MSADQGGSFGVREDGDSLLFSQIIETLDIVFIFCLCITNRKKQWLTTTCIYYLTVYMSQESDHILISLLGSVSAGYNPRVGQGCIHTQKGAGIMGSSYNSA